MINLYKAFGKIKSEKEFNDFISDLCTEREIRELNSRWKIAQLLWNTEKERVAGLDKQNQKNKSGVAISKIGLSQKDISGVTGAGQATITRVSKCLFEKNNNGYKKILSNFD